MKKYYYLLGSFCIFAVIYVSILHFTIIHYAQMSPPKNVPYVIVLGAKVNNDQMSLSLYHRAKTALNYLIENPDSKVVVTGGQGLDESITEASAIEKFLIENGIDQKRILVEDTSTSTYENLKNTYDLYSIKEAVIVTNTFHSYRANYLASQLNMTTYPLNAKTPSSVKIKSYIREYLAITKTYLLKR